MKSPASRDRPTLASTGIVVLAAGASRRFGSVKQTAVLHGRPLVAHSVVTALAADVGEVVVVVSDDDVGSEVAAAAHGAGQVRVVGNPGSDQSSSLRAGIGALDTATDVAVVLLADQPGIDPAVVRSVAAQVLGGARAARAVYRDAPGHPVAFARAVWPRLDLLTGDRGARDLLDGLGVVEVPVDASAPPDVDEPVDLDALAGLHDGANDAAIDDTADDARDDAIGDTIDDDANDDTTGKKLDTSQVFVEQ